MRRTLLPTLALACAALLASAPAATADDVITPGPSSQPGDPFGGQTVPPGPVIVVTPGSPGSELPAPSDPEDVQEQIDKDREANGGTATPGAPVTPGATPSGSADPTVGSPAAGTDDDTANDPADPGSSWSVWWLLGTVAAALAALAGVLLVARRRRDRAPADSLE